MNHPFPQSNSLSQWFPQEYQPIAGNPLYLDRNDSDVELPRIQEHSQGIPRPLLPPYMPYEDVRANSFSTNSSSMEFSNSFVNSHNNDTDTFRGERYPPEFHRPEVEFQHLNSGNGEFFSCMDYPPIQQQQHQQAQQHFMPPAVDRVPPQAVCPPYPNNTFHYSEYLPR